MFRPTTFRLSLVALVALCAACPGPRVEVLAELDAAVPPPEPIRSCEEAFATGRTGDACVILETPCFRERDCCFDEALCESGVLLLLEGMCELCSECTVDDDCGLGVWCIGGDCLPCAPMPGCPPCPPGLVNFERNGCGTCECVPEAWCEEEGSCGIAGDAMCVPGAHCVPCGEDICCSSACASFDCPTPEPAPEGCAVPCDPAVCPDGSCVNHHCFCDAEGWRCEQECALDPLDPC